MAIWVHLSVYPVSTSIICYNLSLLELFNGESTIFRTASIKHTSLKSVDKKIANNGIMGSFISIPSERINYLLLTFPFSQCRKLNLQSSFHQTYQFEVCRQKEFQISLRKGKTKKKYFNFT